MARDAIVAIFDTRNQAYDAAMEIDRLSDDVAEVKSGAILEKDELGTVTILDRKKLANAWGAVGGVAGGALLGGLLGLLAGPGGAAIGTAAGAAAASSGAAVGGIIGGTTGVGVDLTKMGLKGDYLDQVSSVLAPGKAALVAEVEELSTEAVDRVVTRHGGIIYRSPIDRITGTVPFTA
jgi:uncharacterized membrane protein